MVFKLLKYQDETKEHFVLTGDEIRECARVTGAKLIVVDPWQQFLDDASSSDNNAMRAMIRDVQNAAEETGVAMVLCGNYCFLQVLFVGTTFLLCNNHIRCRQGDTEIQIQMVMLGWYFHLLHLQMSKTDYPTRENFA